ncbi:MAG: chitobiase/beta-hexosaminidase C-terminal domain-containing protein [Planctomycetes bacterium]|nr:chitobiase/beta-hexosaminidase C-terminal domain-containing protein [Planctomycetota bacterium]
MTTRLVAADGAWIAPVQYQDLANKWINEPYAFDGSTSTYADDRSNAAGDGPWLQLHFSTSLRTDRVQVIADFGYGIVDRVDIEYLEASGSWHQGYSGPIANDLLSIVTIAAAPVQTTACRFRFHYLKSGYYFWLYDFKAYRVPDNQSAPVIQTEAATSVTDASAVLHGSVLSDGGSLCGVRFLWHKVGTSTWNSSAWTSKSVSAGQPAAAVLASATQLQAGSTYEYRLEARNDWYTTQSGLLTFTPQVIPESASGWFAGSSATAAAINGMVWQDILQAIDDTPTSSARCYHPLWASQTSPVLTVHLPNVVIDRARVLAGRNPYIATMKVELKNRATSAWTTILNGEFTDRVWSDIAVSRDNYAQARFTFTTSTTAVGTAWELLECQVYKPTPTPLPAPVLSPAAVFGSQPVVVTATALPGSTVRYTLDGTTPTAASPILTGSGVTITASNTLKVIAFQTGWLPSPVVTVTGQILGLQTALVAPRNRSATLALTGITVPTTGWIFSWQVTGTGLSATQVTSGGATAQVTFDQVGTYRVRVQVQQSSTGPSTVVEKDIVVPAVESFIGITALAPVGP